MSGAALPRLKASLLVKLGNDAEAMCWLIFVRVTREIFSMAILTVFSPTFAPAF